MVNNLVFLLHLWLLLKLHIDRRYQLSMHLVSWKLMCNSNLMDILSILLAILHHQMVDMFQLDML